MSSITASPKSRSQSPRPAGSSTCHRWPKNAIEARYDGAGYGKFKEDVGEAVVALFDPIRLRYADLRGNPGELHATLARGAEKAHAIAAETLAQAYERVGFVPP